MTTTPSSSAATTNDAESTESLLQELLKLADGILENLEKIPKASSLRYGDERAKEVRKATWCWSEAHEKSLLLTAQMQPLDEAVASYNAMGRPEALRDVGEPLVRDQEQSLVVLRKFAEIEAKSEEISGKSKDDMYDAWVRMRE